MLRQRVVTAILLMLVLVPAMVWLPQSGWALFAALVIALGAWEWAALAGYAGRGRQAYGLAVFLLLVPPTLIHPELLQWSAPGWRIFLLGIYGLSALFWLILVPLWLGRRWTVRGWSGLLLGLLVLLPAWLAIVQFRALGVLTLRAVLSIAWVADIAAYFTGRAFGKHKLAPAVSPGKTWEGVGGAVLGVLLFGFAVGPWPGVSPWAWALVLVLLTGVSVVGDLFESLLKRLAGIKDSSQLLPGHGGILDRVDSLTAILPVSACFLLLLA